MKIIDLLNKIANGEEVPEYINYTHRVFGRDTMMVCKENIINKLDTGAIELNDEVEILEEEKKIPEKLDLDWQNAFDEQVQQDCIKMILENINIILDYLRDCIKMILENINIILDYLKNKGE